MNEKLEELLVDWEIARQENRSISIESLCAEYPELADELRQEIKRLQETSWIFDETIEPTELKALPANLTTQQVIERLRTANLLPAEWLKQSPKDCLQETPGDLVRGLVESSKLTSYQGQVILGNRTGPLRLGNYLISDEIGEGGMGQVYRATQTSMKRDVAIKVLTNHAQFSSERKQRFVREIESIAKLNHPNIITAFDANVDDGTPYLVMELIEGKNLAETVRTRGPLPLKSAIQVILQIAKAAQFAHENKIVHRDIKPANILLASNGVAKLLDLGIAKVNVPTPLELQHEPLTSDGGLIGTIAYMSPEHALDSSSSDERSDIYSLGCTLFYSIAGRAPFEHENPIQVALMHRERPIEEELELGRVPKPIHFLLGKMLAKSPEDRFQTMAEVASALEGFDGDSTSGSANQWGQQTGASFPMKPVALVTLAITLFVCSGLWFYGNQLWSNSREIIPVADSKSYQNDLARWLTNHGGVVTAKTQFDTQVLVDSSEVPNGPMEITSIDLSSLDEEFSFEWLSEIPTLKRLTLSDLVFFEEDVPHFRMLQQIDELIVIRCELIPEFWKSLSDLKQLKSLSIEAFQNGPVVFKNLKELRSLTMLSLTNADVDDEDALQLMGPLNLRRLDLSGTRVSGATMSAALASEPLTELLLSNCEINDEDFLSIENCETLLVFNLDFCAVGRNMSEYVARLPRLKELYVEGTNVGGREVRTIAGCKNLQHLDIAGTQVGNASLQKLASFPKLNSLSLAYLQIDDSDLSVFAGKPLEYLNLSSTPITDKCFPRLLELKELEVLELSDCKLSEEAIEAFLDQHALCEIVQYVEE